MNFRKKNNDMWIDRKFRVLYEKLVIIGKEGLIEKVKKWILYIKDWINIYESYLFLEISDFELRY